MKSFIKKFIPKSFIQGYHLILAILANYYYKKPTEKLIVIGITGTSGKSTTLELIAQVLEEAGFKVGIASTIRFKVGEQSWLNNTKMTMVGRFQLQKLLARMVSERCNYALIETSSQGIEQFRHVGIHHDVLVFTNLYPEHIDAHGGFENYKKAKLKLFQKFQEEKQKIINGVKIPKVIVVNLDNEYAPEFLGYRADVKYGYTTEKPYDISGVKEIYAKKIIGDGNYGFEIDGKKIILSILGEHNISNALATYCVGTSQNITFQNIKNALEKIKKIPGRIEFINENQPFSIIVDYAFEPIALQKLYDTVKKIPHQRIIHVLGTTGGGRDKARGKILGQIAGRCADIVIATNEDPYDDDPEILIHRVYDGAKDSGKKPEQNLFKKADRRKAIRKALTLASKNDIVLITGKGSEQAMVIKNNKKLPWDDRAVVKKELKDILKK